MFGTSGIRGPVGGTVTAALALSVGRAVGSDADRVLVGRDARDSGRAFVDALAAGLVECGADVVDAGRVATPTLARGIARKDADAGVVVTASHNPPTDNGLKLWTPAGRAFDADERAAVERRIRKDAFDLAAWDGHGRRERWDGATAAHRWLLVDAGRRAARAGGGNGDKDGNESGSGHDPLSGLRVVVDVGNGTGGVTVDALYELGAAVETLNATPDGRFPARPSEPTADHCRSLARTVPAVDADLGIAHDGDADRTMAVTADGEFLSGDVLLAILGRAAVAGVDPDDSGSGNAPVRVAAPVDTSLAVDDALAAVGAEVIRTPVGDVHVAARAAEPGVAFGGEPSGAWVFPDETLCPDGPLAAVRLAVLAAAEPLAARAAAVDRYPIRRESIDTGVKAAAMDRIRERVGAEYDDVSELDGVRIDRGDGWFLLRASGTQPLVRVTAEARTPDRADAILAEARAIAADAVEAAETDGSG